MPPPELQKRAAARVERSRIQLLLNENELRPNQIGNKCEVGFVKFDGDRTNNGAHAPNTEPEKQLLDHIIGEQHDDIAAFHATLRQVRGNASRDVVQLGEIDFRLLVQIDDRRLVRI